MRSPTARSSKTPARSIRRSILANLGPGPHPDSPQPEKTLPRRYHGTVELDPTRVGRDASQIAEEIVAHLVTIADADVTVTIDIEATLPNGATDHAVRTVTDNTRTLNYTPACGFERD